MEFHNEITPSSGQHIPNSKSLYRPHSVSESSISALITKSNNQNKDTHSSGAITTNENKPASFEVIEQDKENIVSLRQGRSASNLVKALSVPLQDKKKSLINQRIFFENELTKLSNLDDPLDVYLQYIEWIHSNFPSGPTNESGLITVLEKCMHHFKDDDYYKNEIRYLKIWLEYISYSDSPRDIFTYMFKKDIGKRQALFYEEFAGFLELNKSFEEADETFVHGLELNARPKQRLERNYTDFQQRWKLHKETTAHITSNSEMAISALSKSGPLSSAQQQEQVPSNSERTANRKPKLQIYQDVPEGTEDNKKVLRENNPGEWAQLESIKTRKKENQIKPTSWIGQTLLQENPPNNKNETINRKAKIPVFEDSSLQFPVTHILHNLGKKSEKLDLNLNLLYPENGEEICVFELLAIARGKYHWNNQKRSLSDRQPENENNENKSQHNSNQSYNSDEIFKEDENDLELDAKKRHMESPKRQPLTLKQTESHTPDPITSTVTKTRISLNDTANFSKLNMSPTLTMYSKEAAKDVYNMINQSIKSQSDYEESYKTDYGLSDFATETITKSVCIKNDEEPKIKNIDKLRQFEVDDNFIEKDNTDNASTPYRKRENVLQTPRFARNLYSDGGSDRLSSVGPIGDDEELEDPESSPFLDAIDLNKSVEPISLDLSINTSKRESLMENTTKLINPFSLSLKAKVLQAHLPLLEHSTTFPNEKLDKLSLFRKMSRPGSAASNKVGDPKKIIELNGELHNIKQVLGEGGYGSVFLAESSAGKLKAFKIESPPNSWEYYILTQIEKRIGTVDKSFVHCHSLFTYSDESCLIMDYCNQGSILDLVNYAKERSDVIDESLILFITVELLKTVGKLHDIGIIHGDLKPDNCMLRFTQTETLPSKYVKSSLGSKHSGWETKGICLIDFGRAIDTTVLPADCKFTTSWETDEQDCPEIRENRPWTYECDYYGLASIIHTMLFGRYISVQQVGDKYKLKDPIKRYWQKELWENLFDILLNPNQYGRTLPITNILTRQRLKIEDWLQLNCYSVNLKRTILKYETLVNRIKR
ncbi:hypothetical protein B5S28_g1245 [[Candida] boidinii]|nr:hypothetical protein B5S28_g1245 [[Candida] boidinii]OWB60909.1 hypothetical protein B5S29_g1792 [[Candida] boidinii]OWB77897.1 hypothetical protein B5S32_g2080 [[Candida] boidinii]